MSFLRIYLGALNLGSSSFNVHWHVRYFLCVQVGSLPLEPRQRPNAEAPGARGHRNGRSDGVLNQQLQWYLP
jgi:hypothetical protein